MLDCKMKRTMRMGMEMGLVIERSYVEFKALHYSEPQAAAWLSTNSN